MSYFETTNLANTRGTQINPSTLEMQESLYEIVDRLAVLGSVKGIAADLRVTVLSGVITSVTTVTGLTNIGGLAAVTLIPNTQNNIAVLSNINNVAS